MTISEILREAKAIEWRHKKDLKEQAYYLYVQPQLVNAAINGKYPKIYEVFPDLYSEEMEQERKMELSAARFLQFANAHNKKYKEGK